jgi:ABC-type branched-subunit amino acid transport system ATPase component
LGFYFVQFATGLASAARCFSSLPASRFIFGITRVLNFAHGAFYMLGAYIGYHPDRPSQRQGHRRLAPGDIWRLGVGRTFQIAVTFALMTAAENVRMALISFRSRRWPALRWAARYHVTERNGCSISAAASSLMATSSGLVRHRARE